MTKLSQENCDACRADAPKLTDKEINSLMRSDSTSVSRLDMAAEAPPDPRALLARNDMGRGEKLELLHQWEFDLREAMVAEEENMPASEPPSFGLAEVLDALRALGATSRFHDVSTKHG